MMVRCLVELSQPRPVRYFLLLLQLLQANHEDTVRAAQELAAKQAELAEARRRQIEQLSAGGAPAGGSLCDSLSSIQAACIDLLIYAVLNIAA